METKLVKKNRLAIIPAGIIEGIEAFWYNNEKWVIFEGKAKRFHEAPGQIQRLIADACRNDQRSLLYLKKKGVVKFSDVFDLWYKCVVGDFECVPDFIDGKFTPDAYIHSCKDFTCVDRGRLCSLKPGLKHFEVATIIALKLGLSYEKTAVLLHISLAGFKSRVVKIREKLDAPNVTSMMAKATEMGI
ncbi:MAG: hypothetical protein HQ522_16130 [Bacteroidetes bacterium]|nr:hypothetical protein [Bacteroidota bacterium]